MIFSVGVEHSEPKRLIANFVESKLKHDFLSVWDKLRKHLLQTLIHLFLFHFMFSSHFSFVVIFTNFDWFFSFFIYFDFNSKPKIKKYTKDANEKVGEEKTEEKKFSKQHWIKTMKCFWKVRHQIKAKH